MQQRTTPGTVEWPADLAARYVARGYWEGRPLLSYVLAAAEANPDAVCLVDGDLRLTYRQLMSRVEGAGARLHGLGLRPDDRVLVQLPNCWEFFVVVLACLRMGLLPVLMLQGHRKQELALTAEHAEARAIITTGPAKGFDHQALAHEVAGESGTIEHVLAAAEDLDSRSVDLAAVCQPSDGPAPVIADPAGTMVAIFVLSGGSTGAPKLIARTHNDFSYMVRRAAQICGVDRDTVYLTTLPLGHGFPFTGALGALFRGGRVVIARSPAPERAFALIEAERVTMTSLVPAIAQRWLDHRGAHPDRDIASLALVQVSGSRIPDEMARRMNPVLGCELQNGYGMGEGLMCLTRPGDPHDIVCGTQGRPICPDDELRLVDEQGMPVAAGEPGILLTRGPYTPRGYYRAEQANARAFDSDGWYNTGDIVRLRPDGYLVVEGRQKDVINRGGEKISAEEIENFAYQSGASLAAAVSMPDAELGERICLYAVGGQFDLAELRETMRAAGVATFKLPERLVRADSLPVTAVGKIDKVALRADIAARLAAADTDEGVPMPKREKKPAGLRALADLATPMAVRVAATLRVADHVAAGRRTAAEIAAEIGAHPDALDRLLRHLTAIGLFERDEHGAYTATELGDQLREDHPAGKRKWLDMAGAIGRGDLSFVELEHSVLTGEPAYPVRYGAPFWADLADDPALSASFDAMMQHHIELDHRSIADAYDWAAIEAVVDVGGGTGGLLSVLLARHANLRGTLVEMPGPAAAARRRFREQGQSGRAEVVTGSFFDPLPTGADAYLLSAVIHDWQDEQAVRILRRCAEAAGEKSRVLVIEAIGADGESPDTGMDLRMLAYYGGKERGLAELRDLAGEAGLAVRGVSPIRQGSFISIVELGAA